LLDGTLPAIDKEAEGGCMLVLSWLVYLWPAKLLLFTAAAANFSRSRCSVGRTGAGAANGNEEDVAGTGRLSPC